MPTRSMNRALKIERAISRAMLPLVVLLAGLVLMDLLGTAIAVLTGAHAGGLLALLPAPLDRVVSPPPIALWTPPGLAGIGALTLAVALGQYGAVRVGAPRLGALALLLALALPLVAWNPLALGVIAGQAVLLTLSRDGRGSETLTQAVRLIGLIAAVLVTWTTAPAMVVSLVAVALAPAALVAVSQPAPRDAVSKEPQAAAPSAPEPEPAPAPETRTEAAPPSEPASPPPSAPASGAPDAEPVAEPEAPAEPTQPAAVFVEPETFADPEAFVEPDTLGEPKTVSERKTFADPETFAEPDIRPTTPDAPGPFGTDPVAALAHLTPAPALVEAARAALAQGEVPLLALVRLDGLAGIAEHLGVQGGEALFAEATGRIAGALPVGSTLTWFGDETFAALLPASAAEDIDELMALLATPFATDLVVEGRAVSMEDALHVDAMALDADILAELDRWAGTAPG
ncbi:hypothetical protein F1188_10115 [Roseospira marina]|uniref:Diguanylate cyclase n=1 Tax=Roseospira marina TaxID=140057 RepID=A0A5M6ICX0_9PROT|nr:hypothetical protein [Roseospira marina]KAA5605585.1 hypothetical protein F1188_10115 [Roseospira marina]MBB4313350.1 GGDEF domain-containing protein [Roseospira marina]MBB5085909.1 GGDEF domain-containing protein [Roseospira marina]